jgi:hypothetical protein
MSSVASHGHEARGSMLKGRHPQFLHRSAEKVQ